MKIRLTFGTFLASMLFIMAYFVVPVLMGTAGIAMATAAVAIDEAAKAELVETIKKQVESQLETRAKKEDILAEINKALKQFEGLPLEELRKLADADKGVMAILVAQGAEIAALKESPGNKEDLSVRNQVAKWMEGNKELITRVRGGQRIESLKPLELRVVTSPMTPANTLNSSAYLPQIQMESGIHDIRRVQPTFWDYLPKGRSSSAVYVWVNKRDAESDAAFIGAGVAKPGVSFELETETSTAKKIAAKIKVATELLEDIDGMTTFIQGELRYALLKKINTTLMTDAGSSTVPEGIQSFSVAYDLTTVLTDNPNLMDVIRAGIAQLRTNFIQEPVTVFIHPVDAANMDMAKASDSGVYLLPPFVTSDGRTVAGAQVVEDNNITPGYIQFACLGLLKTLIYKDYVVNFGWENDDFTKNLVTAIGEVRLHFFHSDVDSEGFIYDAIQDIKTAIAQS